MKVAINGCCHGELNALYEMVQRLHEEENIKIDLLICCGDFQCLRTEEDLRYFCAPPKYRQLKDFHEYFNGSKKAPVLTLVIGGNHEAPNVLRELYYGGWLAPNIFYLGHSGVVNVGGIRIAGLSGIYDRHHFNLGHFERPPYDSNTARSAYHVRQFELLKLHCIEEPVDIMLSHDWPEGIYEYGDKEMLLRCKPHFRSDVQNRCLGSPPSMALLKSMKPSFWFCGHLHVFFPALVRHEDGRETRFIALDKVLPKRSCLQVVDIHPSAPAKYLKNPSSSTNININLTIEFDVEWLAILRANRRQIPTQRFACNATAISPTEEDKEYIRRSLLEINNNTREKKEESKTETINQTTIKEEKDIHTETMQQTSREIEKEREEEIEKEKHKYNQTTEDDDINKLNLLPWPHWSNPPFYNLQQQRKQILKIIGMQDADIFDDTQEEGSERYSHVKSEEDKQKNKQINIITVQTQTNTTLLRRPQEEISLTLDDI